MKKSLFEELAEAKPEQVAELREVINTVAAVFGAVIPFGGSAVAQTRATMAEGLAELAVQDAHHEGMELLAAIATEAIMMYAEQVAKRNGTWTPPTE